MRQKVATAALACESKVVHRSALCGLLGCGGKVDQLVLLGATIFNAIALDELKIALPFARNGEIARVATNRNREIHVPSSWYLSRLPFFLSAEETMKRAYIVLGFLLVGLLVALAVLGQKQGAFPGVVEDLPARVQRDLANEKRRFLPENSVDISMAMKLITHDPPSMLVPPEPGPPLLLYPPSADTLARLSGE